MNVPSLVGGLAGAGTLTLLNETVRRFDSEAPRLDLLGRNAVAKILKSSSVKALPVFDSFMPAAVAGDLISNSLYYAMAQAPTKKETYVRGALLGIGAGLGAVTLAKPLGIDPTIGQQPLKTKALTVAWYLIGGLAAAAIINLITKDKI
jgi:hypothetical protein